MTAIYSNRARILMSLLLGSLFAANSSAQCPGTNTGYINAQVSLNNAAGGTDPWNNPGNALTDNNSYATMSNAALLIGGTVRNSNYLVLRNLNKIGRASCRERV